MGRSRTCCISSRKNRSREPQTHRRTPSDRIADIQRTLDHTVDRRREVQWGDRGPAASLAERTVPENRRLIAERQAIESLTSNERSIIRLIAEGKSNGEIADLLHLSPRTVETYRARLMQKLKLQDLVALVKFAIRNGMSSVD